MKNLRWMWRYIKYVKAGFAAALFLLVLDTLVNLSTVYLQKSLIDQVFIGRDYGKFPQMLLLFALVFIAYAVLGTVKPYMFVRNEYSLIRLMFADMIQAIHRMPTRRFHSERTTKYVHYITSDMMSVASLITWQMPHLLQALLTTLFLMITIGMFSPLILAAVVTFTVVYVGLAKYFVPKMKQASRAAHDRRTAMLIHLEEGISSTREVISFHRMKWERHIYNGLFEQYFDRVMAEGRLKNKQMMMSNPIKWGVMIAVLGIGGYQLMEEEITIGIFVIVFQFANQLLDSLNRGFEMIMEYSSNLAQVDRINQVLQEERMDDGDRKLQGRVTSLSLDNVSFRYDEQLPLVLKNMTLDIPIGRKVAFVGTSGGGKSTIAQLLLRFYDPSSGDIVVNGVALGQLRRDSWAERIRIVFQEPYLLPDTIRQNLLLGRNHITEEKMIESCKVAQIHDVIAKLPEGYDSVIGERGITLSGGQRQRLALARALLDHPEILILDEATSALDLETERQVQRSLDEIRQGRTTIIIAHRLSTVMNADLIVVMDQGRVAEQGSHEELMAGDTIYKSLVYAEQQSA
ncbi:ABC transporter ATP-binding protein [Paenibacillus sp. GCM10027629]|uniref:ABC transporter ATP-binding protein n=1 Tax=Paenibacillus sp. GCM10027629 TaxID=3273414 RepID=UPI0036306E7D